MSSSWRCFRRIPGNERCAGAILGIKFASSNNDVTEVPSNNVKMAISEIKITVNALITTIPGKITEKLIALREIPPIVNAITKTPINFSSKFHGIGTPNA